MGRYSNSGQAHGTLGSPQLSIDQSKLSAKVDTLNEKLLIKELENNGIKFNKKDIKFITKDKSGQTVWLETGNLSAGLKHIVERHEKDFKNAYNISKSQIPSYIKNVIKNGEIISSTTNSIGYTKVYKHDSKYYLVTGIGNNGFIVSAHPYNSKGGKYGKD
jgi:hypothetical protein